MTMTSDAVQLERVADVLVISINNPPVNAGSQAVRRGVLDAVRQLDADATLHAAVLLGSGTTFVAGSDLSEFGRAIESPLLPDVIAAIEQCDKPIVAALHGAALGGGFELALGCDARIASAKTVVGLPEVTLGMIPGAGGTQRMPRLIGSAKALELICSGERINAERALETGLIDAIVSDGSGAAPRAAAIELARSMIGRKQRVRDRAVPVEEPAVLETAEAKVLRAGKARPAIKAAIEAVRMAAQLPIDEALARERELFTALRTSPDAANLRYVFFAERQSSKVAELQGVTPRPVERIAVIGAGTMGCGIAINALECGFEVVLLDQDLPAIERGALRLDEHFAARVAAGKSTAAQAESARGRCQTSIDWSLLSNVDLVIEAVFEDLAVKQAVFERIDTIARAGTVLASNTSYLDLDAIASATHRAGDVVGMHFFSPANVMRLVEVVRTRSGEPVAIATALDVAKRLRKQTVLTGNAFGFIGNRVYAAYRLQCEMMLEDGANPEQVDSALESFGFAMGPFAVADLSGLDIAWRMRQARAALRRPNARYIDIPDRLCEAGRLGRKTGVGYYRYSAGARRGQPDDAVRQVIETARQQKGIVARAVSDDEIVERALLAMANEAALLFAEGVAMRPSDIDVVLINGYGFPRWQGGPVRWANQQDLTVLADRLDWLARLSGAGFSKGRLDTLRDASSVAR